MATYLSILSWEILWTEEPGGLQSEGSQRVRHDEHAHTRAHEYIMAHPLLPPSLACCFMTIATTVLGQGYGGLIGPLT